MEYLLGIEEKGFVTPLNIELEGRSILNVINFTCSFVDEVELRNYLINNHIIDNYNANLCYIISKGNKNDRKYDIVDNRIYTSNNKRFFKVENLKKYLLRNVSNFEYIKSLYLYYIKKVGYLTKVKENLEKIDINIVNDLLGDLSKFVSDTSKNLIVNFINSTHSNYYDELNQLIDSIHDNLEDDIILINYFIDNIDVVKIPVITCLKDIYLCVKNNNQVNEEAVVDSILKSTIYKKDGIEISERKLFDLASFNVNYSDYQSNEKDYLDEYNKEYDEFLTEEDFQMINSSSEREGFVVR